MLKAKVQAESISSNDIREKKSDTSRDLKNHHMRHLDHLADLTDGVSFTAIPQKLMQLYLNKQIPEVKFRLICVMLSHSRSFQIWSSYLRKRFSPGTLKKYLPEIVKDGYVRTEVVDGPRGSKKKLYHTNPISEWVIYQKVEPAMSNDLCSPMNSSPVNSSPVNTITKSTHNKTNCNKTNIIRECDNPQVDALSDKKDIPIDSQKDSRCSTVTIADDDAPSKESKLSKTDTELEEIIDTQLRHYLKHRPKGKPNRDEWRKALKKIQKEFKWDNDTLYAFLVFLANDRFWGSVSFSPVQWMRRRKGREDRIIDNMIVQALKKDRAFTNAFIRASQSRNEKPAKVQPKLEDQKGLFDDERSSQKEIKDWIDSIPF